MMMGRNRRHARPSRDAVILGFQERKTKKREAKKARRTPKGGVKARADRTLGDRRDPADLEQ